MARYAGFLYDAGIPIVLGLVLLLRRSRDDGPGRVGLVGSRLSGLQKVGVLLVACGVVLVCVRVARVDSGAGVAPAVPDGRGGGGWVGLTRGVIAGGEYKNPFLGFRIPFGRDWHPVDDAAVLKANGGKRAEGLLLVLVKDPGGGDHGGSLGVVAERLGPGPTVTTGREYLVRALRTFEAKPQPPRGARIEPGPTFAGMAFDRLTFLRSWGDGEVGMTYWATVKNGHVLCFTGTYHPDDGPAAIERLLGTMTPVPAP